MISQMPYLKMKADVCTRA